MEVTMLLSNRKSIRGFPDSYENFLLENSLFAFTPHPNERKNESARCGAFLSAYSVTPSLKIAISR